MLTIPKTTMANTVIQGIIIKYFICANFKAVIDKKTKAQRSYITKKVVTTS